MPEPLKPADFRDLEAPLSLDVNLAGVPQSMQLRVQSVTPLPPHRLREEPFSLVLAGPLAPALRQASYRLRHPRLGDIDLFLVPINEPGNPPWRQVLRTSVGGPPLNRSLDLIE